jgi:hypothetical protein
MPINNIDDLRKELIGAFEMLKKDPKRAGQVGELANTAGKVINSVKIELEYASVRKERPEIPFLVYSKEEAPQS